MSDSPTEDFLEHYGVKGMHWGKHKAKGNAVEVSKKSTDVAIRKDKLKAARADLYSGAKQHYKTNGGKVEMGLSVASALLGGTLGTAVVGTRIMRSAGYSKGKSVAMGLIGGAPGAALAVELKARRIANGDS